MVDLNVLAREGYFKPENLEMEIQGDGASLKVTERGLEGSRLGRFGLSWVGQIKAAQC